MTDCGSFNLCPEGEIYMMAGKSVKMELGRKSRRGEPSHALNEGYLVRWSRFRRAQLRGLGGPPFARGLWREGRHMRGNSIPPRRLLQRAVTPSALILAKVANTKD